MDIARYQNLNNAKELSLGFLMIKMVVCNIVVSLHMLSFLHVLLGYKVKFNYIVSAG